MSRRIEGNKPAAFWRNGVVAMTGAALLSKLIGSLQKIPLQNMAGDRVFGLYNAVYPLYQLVAVLATAGLPTAVSIVIARRAQAAEDGGPRGERLALLAALLLLGVSGTVSFLLMWAGASRIAAWIGDASAAPAIRMLAIALLLSPLAAALRGFMQGRGLMTYSALSQVADQLVRVAVMLSALGAGLVAGWSEAALAAAVMSGSAAGAGAALLLLGLLLSRLRKGNFLLGDGEGSARERASEREDKASREDGAIREGTYEREEKASREGMPASEDKDVREGMPEREVRDGIALADAAKARLVAGVAEGSGPRKRLGRLWVEIKELAGLALPAALAAIVVPALGVVDVFTVPRFLLVDGHAEASAMEMFGIYSRAQPLVQLVIMAAGAASAALVPGFVAAKQSGQFLDAGLRLSLLMRISWIIGAASALGLAMLAEPINIMLYKDAQGTAAFALTGLTALAGCVSAASAPALQSLGATRVPAALLLLAALLKGVLNAALVPSLGIQGAAISGVAALSAAAMLGAAALRRAAASAGAPPHVRPAAGAGSGMRPAAGAALALAAMAAALWLLERGLAPALGHSLPPRMAAAVLALTGVAAGACVFAAAVLRCGVIGAREWRVLPGGEALAARLRRWRLLPPQ
jgi:O-antigen/teichoic acid export membrane protein